VRIDPNLEGDENELITEFLDYQRETILTKTEGLSHEQLVQIQPPSRLTLAGILYHLTLVEENWFEVRFAGLAKREPWASIDWESDPDWEFRTAEKYQPEWLRDRYHEALERSRRVVEAAGSLDQMSAQTLKDGRHFSLRWLLLHLIEETARHAGHADLLREAIDGSVGE